MTRNVPLSIMHLILRVLLVVAVLAASGCAVRPAPDALEGGAADSRPNVLLLIIDDLRPALGAYGDPTARTPHLDRLAAESVLFERAYVHQAICAPSRIHLLSGLRPASTGIYNLDTALVERLPGHVTLPQHFRRHGYETVSIGKVYHPPQDDPGGWDRRSDPEGRGVGRGYLTAEAAAQMDARGFGPAYEAAAVADTAYGDGKVAEAAVVELAGFAKSGRPFFLAVGLRKPHLPFNCPQRYWTMHPPESVALPENDFPPRDSVGYALSEDLQEIRAYVGIPRYPPIPTPEARTLVRGYRACVSYADALAGRVLDALQAEGLAENTVVVVWGDHGYKTGEHGAWAKHTAFEIDTHVPLLVRAPGMAPARTRALTETVDVFASLAELADWLARTPDVAVAIVGHTDADGSLEGNIAISRRRAQAVVDRLVADYGVPAGQLTAAGMGYLAPVASNLTPDGRAANRRVEAVITGRRSAGR